MSGSGAGTIRRQMSVPGYRGTVGSASRHPVMMFAVVIAILLLASSAFTVSLHQNKTDVQNSMSSHISAISSSPLNGGRTTAKGIQSSLFAVQKSQLLSRAFSGVGNASGLLNSTYNRMPAGIQALNDPASTLPVSAAGAAYQQLLSNVTSAIAKGQIKQYYAYLPNFHPSAGYGVSPLYTTQPAPMGIADYGLGAAGSYTYYTPSFNGTVSLNSYATYTPGNYVVYTPNMSGIQLNTVLANVTVGNSINGVYWIQNVALINGTTVTFIDNIWNFSAPGASLNPNAIYSGKGNVTSGFYYFVGPTINVTYPLTMSFYNNALLYQNRPTVFFNYSYSLSGGAPITGSYDRVMFNSTTTPVTPAFEVNGSAKNPFGLMYDSELIFGGPGGGSNAMIQNMSGHATMQYMSGGSYRNIQSAYSYGSDTGETSQGISAWWLGKTEYLSQGPSNLSGLWNTTSSEPTGYIHLSAQITPSWAFAFAGKVQSSYAPVTPSGYLNFTVSPGTYNVVLMTNDYAQFSKSFSGNLTTTYTMTQSAGLLYTPIYMHGNAQAKAITTLLSSPDSISHLTILLNASFMITNGFGYPSFVLLDVEGVTTQLLVQNLNESNQYIYGPGGKVSASAYNKKYDFFFSSHSILRNVSLSGGFQMANIMGSNNVTVRNISGNTTIQMLICLSRYVTVNYLSVFGGIGAVSLLSSSVTVTNLNVTLARGATNSIGAEFVYTDHSSVSGASISGNGTSSIFQTIGVEGLMTNYSSFDNMNVSKDSIGYLGFSSFNDSIYNMSASGRSIGYLSLLGNSSDINNISADNGSAGAVEFGSYSDASNVSAVDNSTGVVMFGNEEHVMNILASNNSTAAIVIGNFSTVLGIKGTFAQNGFVPALPYANATFLAAIVGGNDTISRLGETGYHNGTILNLDHSTFSKYTATNSSIGLIVGGPGHNLISYSNISESSMGVGIVTSNSTFSHISTYKDAAGFIVQGNSNSITHNLISYDSGYGVNISGGTGNNVYYNSFIDNNGSTATYNSSHIQAYSVAGNFFNMSSTGNYWADWHTAYPNGTLEPYLISNGVYDYHPLGTSIVTTFQFTFTETGLAAGTNWSVSVNGHQRSSTTGTITFMEPNGTYQFQVGGVAGYTATPQNGSETIAGSPVSVPVSFAQKAYAVTFTEAGLPAGSVWAVTLNGVKASSSTGTITFSEPNGTYTFSVLNQTDFYASPFGGQVTVNGGAATQSVQFLHYAYITGSILPATAAITVNGVAVAVSSGTFNVSVTAGTYSVVASMSGYKTFYSNVTVTAGQFMKLTIGLKQTTPNNNHNVLPLPLTYIEIGVLILVIVVVAAAIAAIRKSRRKR